MRNLDGVRPLPGVRFNAASNGYFLWLGNLGLSFMPKRKTAARKRYFHVNVVGRFHLYVASRPGRRFFFERWSS